MIRYSTLVSQIYEKTHHQLIHNHCQRMSSAELRSLGEAYLEQAKVNKARAKEHIRELEEAYLAMTEKERLEMEVQYLEGREDAPKHGFKCPCKQCKKKETTPTTHTHNAEIEVKAEEEEDKMTEPEFGEDEEKCLSSVSVVPAKMASGREEQNVHSGASSTSMGNSSGSKHVSDIQSEDPEEPVKAEISNSPEENTSISSLKKLEVMVARQNERKQTSLSIQDDDKPGSRQHLKSDGFTSDRSLEDTRGEKTDNVEQEPHSKMNGLKNGQGSMTEQEWQRIRHNRLRRELRKIVKKKQSRMNKEWLKAHPTFLKHQTSDHRIRHVPLSYAESWKRKIMRLYIYKQAFSALASDLKAYDPLLFDIKKAYDDMLNYCLDQQRKARFDRVRICLTKKGLRSTLKGYHFHAEDRQLNSDMYAYYIMSRTVNQDKALRIASSLLKRQVFFIVL